MSKTYEEAASSPRTRHFRLTTGLLCGFMLLAAGFATTPDGFDDRDERAE